MKIRKRRRNRRKRKKRGERRRAKKRRMGVRKRKGRSTTCVYLPQRSMQLPESHSAPDRSEYHHCPRHRSVVYDSIRTVLTQQCIHGSRE